jgi:hypothetical protein
VRRPLPPRPFKPPADAAAVAILIATVVALLPSFAVAQAPPPDFDEGLFDVVITRELSGALIVLQNRRGEVLLPLRPVLQLTELPYERDSPGRLQVRRSGEMAVVDLETLRLELPDTVIEIDPDRLIAAYDDLYLPGPLLARLIDAEVDVDFGHFASRAIRPSRPRSACNASGSEPGQSASRVAYSVNGTCRAGLCHIQRRREAERSNGV